MPQSQADFRKAMSEPRTITLTRAEMEMVVGLVQTAESTYWNGGKTFPGYAAARDIVDKASKQVPDCVGRTADPID